MLVRKPDWQSQLQRFLLRSLTERFSYGEKDCCLWVANAVYAMTDRDIAVRFRGKYHDRSQAMDLCSEYTGKRSVRALVCKALAEQHLLPVTVECAQRGDIALVKRSSGYSLGLISLNGKEIVAASAQGYLRLPLNLAVFAWRV